MRVNQSPIETLILLGLCALSGCQKYGPDMLPELTPPPEEVPIAVRPAAPIAISSPSSVGLSLAIPLADVERQINSRMPKQLSYGLVGRAVARNGERLEPPKRDPRCSDNRYNFFGKECVRQIVPAGSEVGPPGLQYFVAFDPLSLSGSDSGVELKGGADFKLAVAIKTMLGFWAFADVGFGSDWPRHLSLSATATVGVTEAGDIVIGAERLKLKLKRGLNLDFNKVGSFVPFSITAVESVVEEGLPPMIYDAATQQGASRTPEGVSMTAGSVWPSLDPLLFALYQGYELEPGKSWISFRAARLGYKPPHVEDGNLVVDVVVGGDMILSDTAPDGGGYARPELGTI